MVNQKHLEAHWEQLTYSRHLLIAFHHQKALGLPVHGRLRKKPTQRRSAEYHACGDGKAPSDSRTMTVHGELPEAVNQVRLRGSSYTPSESPARGRGTSELILS
jgi:hypothetical protein